MTGAAGAMIACLAGLALMGALPGTFFRRGRLTAGWWFTAAPFLVASATLVAGLAGWLDPLVGPAGPRVFVTAGLGGVLSVGGAALIGYAVGSHTRPVSLWHQEEDAPEVLATRGAYRRIRHPFYAAFILLLTGCVLAFPHLLTVLAWVTGTLQLHRTARREERRILASHHGDRYRAYLEETGRFVPPIRRSGAQSAPNSRMVVTVRSSPGSNRVEVN